MYPLHSSAFDLDLRSNGALAGMADVVCFRHQPTQLFAELKSYLIAVFSFDLRNLAMAAHPCLAGSLFASIQAGLEPGVCSLSQCALVSANRGLGALKACRGEIPFSLRSTEVLQADCRCCHPEPINKVTESEIIASDDQAYERPSL